MELGGAREGGAREGGARSKHHTMTPNHSTRDTSLVTPDCCKEATPRRNDFEAVAPPATAPRPTLRVVAPAPLKPPPPAKPAGCFIKVPTGTTRLAGIEKPWVGPGRCGPGTMRVRLIIAGGMIGTTQDSDDPPAAEPVSWQDDGAGAVNDRGDTDESDADESVQKWFDAIRSAPKTVRGYEPHMGEKMDGIVEGVDIGSAEAKTMDATKEQLEEWINTTDAVTEVLRSL